MNRVLINQHSKSVRFLEVVMKYISYIIIYNNLLHGNKCFCDTLQYDVIIP